MSESHKAAFATSEVTSLASESSYARIIRDDTAEPNQKRRGKPQRCAASSYVQLVHKGSLGTRVLVQQLYWARCHGGLMVVPPIFPAFVGLRMPASVNGCWKLIAKASLIGSATHSPYSVVSSAVPHDVLLVNTASLYLLYRYRTLRFPFGLR